MVQAIGILLMLLGAVMWHVASQGAHSFGDAWFDMVKTFKGKV